jgi:hypothetical protein
MKRYIILSEGKDEMPAVQGFDTVEELEEYVKTLKDIERGVQADKVGQDVAKLVHIRDVVRIMFQRYPEAPVSSDGVVQPWRYFATEPSDETLGIACFRLCYAEKTIEVLHGEYIRNLEEIPIDAAYALAELMNGSNYKEFPYINE